MKTSKPLLGLSNGGEPRVPPLPNELIASSSSHVTNHVTSPITSVASSPAAPNKRRWNQDRNSTQEAVVHTPERKRRQSERDIQQAIGMLRSMEDPSKCHQVTVQDPVKAGMSKELKDHFKECEIVLERIDQELLELGPFAKDTHLRLKEEPNMVMVGLPGGLGGGVQPLTSPPTMLMGGGGGGGGGAPRRSRKGQRSSNTGGRGSKETFVGKGKSELSSPASVSSASLADEKTSASSAPKEKEVPKNLLPQGKWRKVGSAGSPVVPSPMSHLPPKKPSSSSNTHPYAVNVDSPGSDSRELPPLDPHHSQHRVSKTASKSAKSKGSSDIDSPSMIPAASEIEMLSLYMPNSPWETIESSPLHPEHDSPRSDVSSARQSLPPPQRDTPPLHLSGSTKTTQQNIASEVLYRVDHAPLHSVSTSSSLSYNSESVAGERGHGHVEIDTSTTLTAHMPVPAVIGSMATPTTAASWPSPLTTAVTRHSHKQAGLSTSDSAGGSSERVRTESSALSQQQQQQQQTGELRRHIVVKDGTPVVAKPNFSVGHLTATGTGVTTSSTYHQSATPPFYPTFRRDTRSTTPIERSSVTSPASGSGGHMTHGSSSSAGGPSAHLTSSDINSPTYIKHRRSSSSSSLRSIKQLDDRKQPTPPAHHQRGPSSSSPMQISQQQIQYMGGMYMYIVCVCVCVCVCVRVCARVIDFFTA